MERPRALPRGTTRRITIPEFSYIAGCDPHYDGDVPIQLYRLHKNGWMEKI